MQEAGFIATVADRRRRRMTEAAERGFATRWSRVVSSRSSSAPVACWSSWTAFASGRSGKRRPEAGYFPFLTGTCLLAAGLWIAVATRSTAGSKLAGTTFVTAEQMKPVLSMLLPTIAYVVAIKFIGIYLASARSSSARSCVWKGSTGLPTTLSVSASASPVAMFLLFEIWFLVALPKGTDSSALLGY